MHMSTPTKGVIGKDSSTDELPENSAPPTDGVHHDTALQQLKDQPLLKASRHRRRLPFPSTGHNSS